MSRKRRFPRIIGLFIALVALFGGLTACSQTYPNACGFIIGNGGVESHKVKKVLLPSESAGNTNDDVQYVPCNARNYIIAPDSADFNGTVNVVAGGTEGAGTQVSIRMTAHFQLNQNRDALKEFYNLCAKYSCYTTDPEAEDNKTANFATAGWMGMLNENFKPAIERTARATLRGFPANVWSDSSQYDAISSKLEEGFAGELSKSTGTSTSFFCGVGSTEDTCGPVTFTIEGVTTTDPNEAKQYYSLQSQLKSLQQQGQILDQQAENARKQAELYAQPGYAQERQIQACTDSAIRATCVFGGGNVTVQVPASPAATPAG